MDNKERILQCALDLFYAKGYDAVGVQEIAEKAGITKPTLYYYFGSKYGLLETLLTTRFAGLRDRLVSAAEYHGDVSGTLYKIASVFLDFAVENDKFYVLFMALFYSAKENDAYRAVKPMVVEFYRTIVQFFNDAARELGNMNGRQEQFAIGFIGLINHYILLRNDGEDRPAVVEEEKKKALVKQFMYGIYS